MENDLGLIKENGRLRQEIAKHQTEMEAMELRLRSAEQLAKTMAKTLGKIGALTSKIEN